MEICTLIITSSWIMLTFFISHTWGNVLMQSFQFLNNYNDMDFESIIVVSDSEGNGTNYEYLSILSFSQYTPVPVVFINADERIQTNLENSFKKSTRALVILYDYETSKRVQDILVTLPSSYLAQNCWLLILPTYLYEMEINEIMTDRLDSKQDIQLNSQIYSLAGTNEEAQLFEIYRRCANHQLSIKVLADFVNGSITKHNDDFIWDRRNNLELCELKIAYVDWSLLRLLPNMTNPLNASSNLNMHGDISTYNQKQVLQSKGKTFTGPETHMFNLLLSALNFSVSWIHPVDNHWGTIDQNTRKWNGIVGLLEKNEADMSIASLIVTQLRGTVITYSTPLFEVNYRMLMNKPDSSSTWSVYADAFDVLYWISLALVTALCSIFLVFFMVTNKQEKSTRMKPLNIWERFLSGVSAMFLSFGLQDVRLARDLPKDASSSNRMIFFIICLFGSLNNYIYSSELISKLMQPAEFEIYDLGDILRQPSYKLIVAKGTAQESYLSESFNTEHQKVWSKTVKENGVVANYKVTQEIIDDDYHNVAFIPSPYFEMTSNTRQLHAAPQTYAPTTAAYGFYNNSPYIDLFNHQIRRIIQSGLNTEMPNVKTNDDRCHGIGQAEYRPFNYDEVFTLFFLLGIGLLIALFYCLMENIKGYFYGQEKNKKRKQENNVGQKQYDNLYYKARRRRHRSLRGNQDVFTIKRIIKKSMISINPYILNQMPEPNPEQIHMFWNTRRRKNQDQE